MENERFNHSDPGTSPDNPDVSPKNSGKEQDNIDNIRENNIKNADSGLEESEKNTRDSEIASDQPDTGEEASDGSPGESDLAEQYLNNWKRAQADLENFKKRVAKDKELLIQNIRDDLFMQLLPTVDHLHLALQSTGEPVDGKTLEEGVRLILDGLHKFLESYGVQRIESVGKPFDYNYQEAVKYEETDEFPENTVIKELIPGYKFNDRVLRAAKVVLSRNPDDETRNDNDEKQ